MKKLASAVKANASKASTVAFEGNRKTGHSGSSSSGIPAREVRREATAAKAAVLATTRQSTDSMVAAAGSRATAVCAKVRRARIPAALNQIFQLRIDTSFSGEDGPRSVLPSTHLRKWAECLLLLCGMDREIELLNAELLVHIVDENGVLLHHAVGDVIFLTIDLIFIDLAEHI